MSARKQFSNLDLNTLQINNLGTPVNPNDAATKGYADAIQAYAIQRANHTGTQVAATISNFDTQVRTTRLDQMATPTAAVPFGAQKITGLADPTNPQDGATKNYVDTSLAGVTTGMVLKGTVRVVAKTNINIASAPASIDGVTMVVGDKVLLTAQTTPSQNGLYDYSVGVGGPLTRTAYWDTSAEMTLGSYWVVLEGTSADSFALFTNDAAPTVGTTALNFITYGAAAGPRSYSQTLGAITAGGTLVVTHGLGTRTPSVSLYDSTYNAIEMAWDGTSTTTITLRPDAAVASGAFITVLG